MAISRTRCPYGTGAYGIGPYGDGYIEEAFSFEFAYTLNATSPVDPTAVTTCDIALTQRLLNNLNVVFNRYGAMSTVLVTFFSAVANQLCILLEQTLAALENMSIVTAKGIWLTLWGSYFGVRRQSAEEDNRYRGRILAVLNQPKTTKAVLQALMEPFFLVRRQ